MLKREHLRLLKPGAVIVDIAIDQGGCCETSRVTYHDDPVYTVEGVVHYCVGNMPGAVPGTSTAALANTTLPFGLMIADLGLEEACRRNPHPVRRRQHLSRRLHLRKRGQEPRHSLHAAGAAPVIMRRDPRQRKASCFSR